MTLRLILALLLVVVGITMIISIFVHEGFRREIIPGVVLGAAIVALGVHRTSLILRARGGA